MTTKHDHKMHLQSGCKLLFSECVGMIHLQDTELFYFFPILSRAIYYFELTFQLCSLHLEPP